MNPEYLTSDEPARKNGADTPVSVVSPAERVICTAHKALACFALAVTLLFLGIGGLAVFYAIGSVAVCVLSFLCFISVKRGVYGIGLFSGAAGATFGVLLFSLSGWDSSDWYTYEISMISASILTLAVHAPTSVWLIRKAFRTAAAEKAAGAQEKNAGTDRPEAGAKDRP